MFVRASIETAQQVPARRLLAADAGSAERHKLYSAFCSEFVHRPPGHQQSCRAPIKAAFGYQRTRKAG